MNNNNIKITSQTIPNRGKVRIIITIEETGYYGYGYGYVNSSIDFFNLFGILGTQRGFLVNQICPVQNLDGYYYGYGYEYSANIAGSNRTKKVFFEVVPEFTIDENEEFDLNLGVIGPAYLNTYKVRTVNRKAICYVTVMDVNGSNLDVQFQFNAIVKTNNDDKQILPVTGKTILNDRDSFFDITAGVENASGSYKDIKLKTYVKNSSFYSTDIRLRATIYGNN